jgi:prepilin-type N-terminal cleavage/methylation domain-containing protein
MRPIAPSLRALHRHARGGFTLVEILIVVVILAILASIVVAQVGNAAVDAERSAFVSSLKTFARAANVFITNESAVPPDVDTGTLNFSSGEDYQLEDYIKPEMWMAPTPLGGHWDIEKDEYGYESLLGVHFDDGNVRPDEIMAGVDDLIDDGDLATGNFQKFDDDRFYMILMP